MREIRQSGSEGGAVMSRPDPYRPGTFAGGSGNSLTCDRGVLVKIVFLWPSHLQVTGIEVLSIIPAVIHGPWGRPKTHGRAALFFESQLVTCNSW